MCVNKWCNNKQTPAGHHGVRRAAPSLAAVWPGHWPPGVWARDPADHGLCGHRWACFFYPVFFLLFFFLLCFIFTLFFSRFFPVFFLVAIIIGERSCKPWPSWPKVSPVIGRVVFVGPVLDNDLQTSETYAKKPSALFEGEGVCRTSTRKKPFFSTATGLNLVNSFSFFFQKWLGTLS